MIKFPQLQITNYLITLRQMSMKKNKKLLLIAILAVLINLGLIYKLLKVRSSPITSERSELNYELQITPTIIPRTATFSLTADKTQLAVGEILTATIQLQSEYAPIAADAILNFDSTKLGVIEIKAGKIFSLYPRISKDNVKGRIIVTGMNIVLNTPPPTLSQDDGSFATITLRAKNPGSTEISFAFEYGSTNQSTIVRAGDAQNILSHVENTRILIQSE